MVNDYAQNRVLGSPPPRVATEEIELSRIARAALAQFRSGWSYKLIEYRNRLDGRRHLPQMSPISPQLSPPRQLSHGPHPSRFHGAGPMGKTRKGGGLFRLSQITARRRCQLPQQQPMFQVLNINKTAKTLHKTIQLPCKLNVVQKLNMYYERSCYTIT